MTRAIVLVLISLSLKNFANAFDIQINGIVECKEPVEGNLIAVTFKTDPNRVDVNVTSPYRITGDDLFNLVAHEYKDGEWVYDEKRTNGDIKTYMDQCAIDAWRKMLQSVSPTIEDEYDIPPGNYIFTDVELQSSDITVPVGMKGRFKVDVTIYAEDQPIFCVGVESTISQ